MTGLNGGWSDRPNGWLGGAERERLEADHDAWMRWGPYLAEREWGTVREDYSPDGAAWDYFPHDHARSRAYRWNEDGMAGVCDDGQRLCLALALWNGRDPILKERMFGLTGREGRHGEDAKEQWWYDDAVPSHAWLRWRYAYPLDGYPYRDLIDGDAARHPGEPTFGLLDTGVFDPEPGGTGGSGRWADVTVDYAKAAPDDVVMRVRVENMSVRPATVHVLPTLWFRNTWSWGPPGERGTIAVEDGLLVVRHPVLGAMLLAASAAPDGAWPEALFCENETNLARLYGVPATTPWPKDGIGDHVVHGRPTVNPALTGTKAAVWYRLGLGAREAAEVVVRLTAVPGDGVGGPVPDTGAGARRVLATRQAEADAFHASVLPPSATDGERAACRQAVASLVWSKCHYHYDVARWLDGDPGQPLPPPGRAHGRNAGWRHLRAADVVSVPDPWEHPWPAAWDLAFQAVGFAHVDPRFAKDQLLRLLGERYLHPDGRVPAGEWDFGAADPPVQAWAALRVFEIDGRTDVGFLQRVLHKLLLGAGRTAETSGPAWDVAHHLDLAEIARRLAAKHDPAYADLAEAFLDHVRAAVPVPADDDPRGVLDLARLTAVRVEDGARLWSALDPAELPQALTRLFDERRFLAPTGVRSRSRSGAGYEPGESSTGENSNWRGPVRFPAGHLLVDALRRYAALPDGGPAVEVPAGSGRPARPAEAADELRARLLSPFVRGARSGSHGSGSHGSGPHGGAAWHRPPAAWAGRLTFHEAYHGETGAGFGASHQTGWAALVVDQLAAPRLSGRRGA